MNDSPPHMNYLQEMKTQALVKFKENISNVGALVELANISEDSDSFRDDIIRYLKGAILYFLEYLALSVNNYNKEEIYACKEALIKLFDYVNVYASDLTYSEILDICYRLVKTINLINESDKSRS
jgi:hypothetical protein